MLLEIEKEAEIGVTTDVAWELLRDIPQLTQCVPRVKDLVEIAPGREYSAIVTDRIGPFQISVPVRIDIQAMDPPRRIQAAISGHDARGQARLKGTLEAAADPAASSTRLTVRMHLDVLGKLATLGAAPMRRRADQIFAEFITCVSDRLQNPAMSRILDGGGR